MNLIRAARAFGASFALVLIGALATYAAFTIDVPQGPSLGSNNVNPYTLAVAVNNLNGSAFSPGLVGTGVSVQAAQLPLVNPLNEVLTSTGGGVTLPPAYAGRIVMISNYSGNAVAVFGSNTPFTSGTNDTINGVAGSTAYSLTASKLAICMSPANGKWFCGLIS